MKPVFNKVHVLSFLTQKPRDIFLSVKLTKIFGSTECLSTTVLETFFIFNLFNRLHEIPKRSGCKYRLIKLAAATDIPSKAIFDRGI